MHSPNLALKPYIAHVLMVVVEHPKTCFFPTAMATVVLPKLAFVLLCALLLRNQAYFRIFVLWLSKGNRK